MLNILETKTLQLDRVLAELETDEGIRLYPYRDSLDFWTVGIGCKLPIVEQEQKAIGWNGIYPLSRTQIKELAKLRLIDTIRLLHAKLEWLSEADNMVQDVLYNMSYQLGVFGVLKFKKTLKLLERKEYKKASLEMLDSLWAEQTPNRAKRLSEKIANI